MHKINEIARSNEELLLSEETTKKLREGVTEQYTNHTFDAHAAFSCVRSSGLIVKARSPREAYEGTTIAVLPNLLVERKEDVVLSKPVQNNQQLLTQLNKNSASTSLTEILDATGGSLQVLWYLYSNTGELSSFAIRALVATEIKLNNNQPGHDWTVYVHTKVRRIMAELGAWQALRWWIYYKRAYLYMQHHTINESAV